MVHVYIQSVVAQTTLKLFLKNTVKWLLVSVAVGAAMIMPLSAQTQDKGFVVAGSKDIVDSIASTQGTRWALLIGIANYPSGEGFEVQQLKAPVKDVNALATFLKDPQKGNFDADYVFILTDEEATRRDILINFNEIAKRAAPEDMVIFYFSGHGTRLSDSETTYLIPYDHDLRDVSATCIDFDDLAERIRKMAASKVVVILDACHSGGVKPKGARAAATTGVVKRYLEAFRESEGRALLLSSDQSEVSWETEESGIFTKFLLDGLNGRADANEDGIVTFTEAAHYVERAVPDHTRENFPRIQKPTRRYELGQVRGDIPMAINWPAHEAFRQKHQDLLDKRNAAILRASLAGLSQNLKNFSLQVVKSAHRKTLNDKPLTEQESLLLKEVDALKDGSITAADYVARARAVYNLGQMSETTATAASNLATIDAPDLPDGASVLVGGELVAMPHQLLPGTYNIRLERDGFQPVEMSEVLESAQVFSLRPEWTPITPLRPGIPRAGAFAASLVVPGLGQHLQRRHVRGGLYEAAAVVAGAVALWAMTNHQGTLDDYEDVQKRLEIAAREDRKLTIGVQRLLDEQEQAHDDAESARTLTMVTQIALGVVWAINAVDAGIIGPARQSNEVAFEAYPTSDGAKVLVRARF